MVGTTSTDGGDYELKQWRNNSRDSTSEDLISGGMTSVGYEHLRGLVRVNFVS